MLADYKEFNFYSDNVLDLILKNSKSLDDWILLYTKIFHF